MNQEDYLSVAKQVFATEAKGVADLAEQLDEHFSGAVKAVLAGQGKLIVCGMGKSGIVGKKIAATLASTGTPSFFMHPGEAYHGDLGMVTSDDVFLAISNSGETEEVVKLVPFLRDNQNILICMTGNPQSSLAKSAHFHLNIAVHKEACPLQLAPTSSTTATLAMGDALAVTLMESRGFAPEEFARFHPGGSLGRRLLRRVLDEMLTEGLPVTDAAADVLSLIDAMSKGGLGMAIVPTAQGLGVVTDGDIRRALEQHGQQVFSKTAADLMSLNPAYVPPETRVEDALALMEQRQITRLMVIEDGSLVGVFRK